MDPTPLQKILHKKGWRLRDLHEKVKTYISYPTLLNINHGYKTEKGVQVQYTPHPSTLQIISNVVGYPATKIYEHRHPTNNDITKK